MANTPSPSGAYFIIQSVNRGIAIIGPRYYRGINPSRVAIAVKLFGDPIGLTDLQFDDTKWLMLTGTDVYSADN